MFLTVHNLPPDYRYADINILFKNECGLTQVVLDDLVADAIIGDRVISQKVTVALNDEHDRELLIKGINGFYLNDQQLFVQDVRKKETRHTSYGSISAQGPKSNLDQFKYNQNHDRENYKQSAWTGSHNRADYNQTQRDNDDDRRSYKEDKFRDQGNMSKLQQSPLFLEFLQAFDQSKQETANSPRNSGYGRSSQHADNDRFQHSSNMTSRYEQFQRERSGYQRDQALEGSRRDRSRSPSRSEWCRSPERSEFRRSPVPHRDSQSRHRGSPDSQRQRQRGQRSSPESYREPQLKWDRMGIPESPHAPDRYRHSSETIDTSFVWHRKKRSETRHTPDLDIQSDYVNTLSSRTNRMERPETHHPIKVYNESDVNIPSSRWDKMERPETHHNLNINRQSSDNALQSRWEIIESSGLQHISDGGANIDKSRWDKSERPNDHCVHSPNQEVFSRNHALYDPEEESSDIYPKPSPQRHTIIRYPEQQCAKSDRKIISRFDRFPTMSFENIKPIPPQANLFANIYGKHVTEFDKLSSSSVINNTQGNNSNIQADKSRQDDRSSSKRKVTSAGYDETPAKKDKAKLDKDIYNQSKFGQSSHSSDPKKDRPSNARNQYKTGITEKDWHSRSGSSQKDVQDYGPQKDLRTINDDTQKVLEAKSTKQQKVPSTEQKDENALTEKVENVRECASSYITNKLMRKFKLTDLPNPTQGYLKDKLSSAIAKRVDNICGNQKQTSMFQIIAKYDMMYDLVAEADFVNRIYNGDKIYDTVAGCASRKSKSFKLIPILNDLEGKAFEEEIGAFVDLMKQEFEDPDDVTEDAISEAALERGCVVFFENLIKENVQARLMGIDAKLTVKLQFAKGNLPKMSAIQDFLKDYGSVHLKKNRKGTDYLTEIKTFDNYDNLLSLGSAKIGGITAKFHSHSYDGSLIKLSLPTIVKHRKDFFVSRILKEQDDVPRPPKLIKPKRIPLTATLVEKDQTQTVDNSTDSDGDVVEVTGSGDFIDLTSDQELEEESPEHRPGKDSKEIKSNDDKSNISEEIECQNMKKNNEITQCQNAEKIYNVEVIECQNIEIANDGKDTQYHNVEQNNDVLTECQNTQESNGVEVIKFQNTKKNNEDQVTESQNTDKSNDMEVIECQNTEKESIGITESQNNERNRDVVITECQNTETENIGIIESQNTVINNDVEVTECHNTEKNNDIKIIECEDTEKENMERTEGHDTEKSSDVEVTECQNTEKNNDIEIIECEDTEKENMERTEGHDTEKSSDVEVTECQNTEKNNDIEIIECEDTEKENMERTEGHDTEKSSDVEVTECQNNEKNNDIEIIECEDTEKENMERTEGHDTEKSSDVEVTECQNTEKNNDIEIIECEDTEKENMERTEGHDTEKSSDVEVTECQNTEKNNDIEIIECEDTEKENMERTEGHDTEKSSDVEVPECQNTEKNNDVEMIECENTERENIGIFESQNTEKNYVEVNEYDDTVKENSGITKYQNNERNNDGEVSEYENTEKENIVIFENQNSEKENIVQTNDVEVTKWQSDEKNSDNQIIREIGQQNNEKNNTVKVFESQHIIDLTDDMSNTSNEEQLSENQEFDQNKSGGRENDTGLEEEELQKN